MVERPLTASNGDHIALRHIDFFEVIPIRLVGAGAQKVGNPVLQERTPDLLHRLLTTNLLPQVESLALAQGNLLREQHSDIGLLILMRPRRQKHVK